MNKCMQSVRLLERCETTGCIVLGAQQKQSNKRMQQMSKVKNFQIDVLSKAQSQTGRGARLQHVWR